MFSLLTRRNFRLLWIAHTVSILGDYVFFIAMTFWVYARTGSSLAVGALLIVSGLPITLIAPLAGRAVDRWRKTTIMALAEGSRALLFLTLLAILFAWPTSLWSLYVVSCLQSFIAAFFWAARGATLPDQVDGASLEQANALYQFSDGIVRVGAPTLATLVLLAFGAGGVTAFDATTFLLSAVCLILLAAETLSQERRSHVRMETASAPPDVPLLSKNATAHTARLLFALFFPGALIAFVTGTFSVALPILARQRLSAGPLLYGALVMAQALGEVGMSLLVGHAGIRPATRKRIIGCFAVGGLALAMLPWARTAALALALNLCIGAVSGAITIELLTCLQRHAPASQLGRRLAKFAATQSFAQLSGIGIVSLSAPLLGVIGMFLLDGCLYMGAACWIWLADKGANK